MPKILLCPDSFKGSLTAGQVCELLTEGILSTAPNAEITSRPLADGGEGTLDCIRSALPVQTMRENTFSATGKEVLDEYLIHDHQAFFETAKSCGLHSHDNAEVPVEKRSSYGLGKQIAEAVRKGAREIFVGLGGSCVNDAGSGLLQALGVRYLDSAGKTFFVSGPADIPKIEKIDWGDNLILSKKAKIVFLSDVHNKLLGPEGATQVFGPQKGIKPEQITWFEKTLARFVEKNETVNGKEFSLSPGAGAAGGLGFALLLLGGEFQNGADFLIRLTKLQEKIDRADWVITGEGKTDLQTLSGKLPQRIAALCGKRNKKCVLLSASFDPGIVENLLEYFYTCHSILCETGTLESAISKAPLLMKNAGRNLGRHLVEPQ